MKEVDAALLTDRQRYWLEHLRACSAAGKAIVEYASVHGINAHTMYAAKKVLISKGVLEGSHSKGFRRAQIVDSVAGCEWRINLPNGVSVAFSGIVDERALTVVLSTAMAID